MRFFAAWALGNLGNASEAVVQALLDLLQDNNLGVREFAAKPLEKLGINSEPEKQKT